MPTKVQGVLALRKALREFEPDLAKETTKQIAGFLKPLVKDAKGFMPSNSEVPSGFVQRPRKTAKFPMYDATIAKRGISYKSSPSKANRSGFRALASIFNKSAAGAIYETAGRKSGIRGNFTPRFSGQLVGDKQKMQGRAMFRAYEKDEGKAKAAVIKAIQASAVKFNATKENV
jgi:hypothetical protein